MKIPKKMFLNFVALSLVLTGCFVSCHSQLDNPTNDYQNGIIPKSIAQITDVFELKYGEVKDTIYDGQPFKFSIADVHDSLQRCDVIYSADSTVFNKIRIHAFLNVEIKGNTFQLKVSSKQCGPFFIYNNDGTDIQQVWDTLSVWQYDTNSTYGSNFEWTFKWALGEGVLIAHTPFSIYMASAYPIAYMMKDNPSKNMYKFIFIITNQKTK